MCVCVGISNVSDKISFVQYITFNRARAINHKNNDAHISYHYDKNKTS